MLEYLMVLVIAFLGVFAGAILALIAPEELKSGRKYWIFTKYLLVLLMIIAIFYYSVLYSNIITAILLGGAIVLLKLAHKEYLGFVFVIYFGSITSREFLFIAGSLVFIYGLLIGTLQSYDLLVKKRKINLKLVGKALLNVLNKNKYYLVVGLILLPFKIFF